METQLMPPEENGRGWEQDLEELAVKLQFSIETPGQSRTPSDGSPVLTIVSIYHKTDRDLCFEVGRHLDLLSIPGYHLERRVVPLTTDAKPERHYITSLLAKTEIRRAHLILLFLSVDTITALLEHKELWALLDTEDSPTILPIALRPVFWQHPSIHLDPVPEEAVTLYTNRDVAHTTIAKTVHWLLTAAVEDANEEDDDAE